MDAQLMLYYGDRTLMGALDSVPQDKWEVGGVCGVWSVKDIIGHFAAYELMLGEVLSTFLDGGPTPLLDSMGKPGANFNDDQAALRKDWPSEKVLAEYQAAFARNKEQAARVPADLWTKKGTIPWYGEEYSLDDFLVFTNYAHKREHTAEIGVFRDRLTKA
ncbi:MAG: DinB family protein [Anaerolineae bacterium]|nr:DinB family protein [Anaerolineae bacterium]